MSETLMQQEDVLYAICFDAGEANSRRRLKHHIKALGEAFGMDRMAAAELVHRCANHDGNARCGILSRFLSGYSHGRIKQMVLYAAMRDNLRIGGYEGGFDHPAIPLPAEEIEYGSTHEKEAEIAPYEESGHCAAGSNCVHVGDPLPRRRDAKYHPACKQRAYRQRRRAHAR